MIENKKLGKVTAGWHNSEDLSIGVCRYEIGLFSGNELKQVFRTDLEEHVPVLRSEAERQANFLKKNDSMHEYSVRDLY